VTLLNDLEALAQSAGVLMSDEVATLQEGTFRAGGNAVVIAAGTGLGQAYLHRVDGKLRPVASEGGHADFAPRTDREIELLKMLRAEYGRAEIEHILCGPGLLNLHRFTHASASCSSVDGLPIEAWAAAVSVAAMSSRCARCVEALDLFVTIYGAEAGNLALRGVATAGVYIGGGIAPKILPALQDGRFLDAFRAKGAMSALVAAMPVKVIVNPAAGLIGAAIRAQELLDT
jgi:glucokinase